MVDLKAIRKHKSSTKSGSKMGSKKGAQNSLVGKQTENKVETSESGVQTTPEDQIEETEVQESTNESGHDEDMFDEDLSQNEAGDEDSSEDEESNYEDDEDDDFPRKKKAKLSKHNDGSSGFSTAINAILGSHLKAHDRKDPIMARKKNASKKLESDKLEAKAKRAMLAEKKKLLNKSRTKDIIPTISAETDSGAEIREVLEKERRLRKIAQKGVVKLFNAILSTQVKTERDGAEKLSDIKNRTEKKDMLTDLSKEKFLDLVKAAGDS
ncbi:LAME_0F09692g1_1 [Lachancea meyersii CBS 8951]|uniref:LAME_0F09692g1_1 n=1 Tax=Lachancea meyersii CBS 8951 TaxID=1266667 RepID=A0A1G4JV27_9SACH|nr:LAME_0F09692g1_1 [Lachancea meyersii CBS 8951]